MHWLAPTPEVVVPGAHGWQEVPPEAGAMNPTVQLTHDDEPVLGWTVPGEQEVKVDAPVPETKLPAGAGRQEVDPVLG